MVIINMFWRRMVVLAVTGILVLPSTAVKAQSLSANAIEQDAMTLDRFYQKVLLYYPKLKTAKSDVDLAIARKMQASAGFWPSFSISAGMSETDDPVNVFGLLMRQERFSQADFDLNRLNSPRHQRDLQGGIHVRWPLFDAMQTVRRTRAAREQIKAVQNDEEFLKMETFLLAHDAFTSALALDKMLAAAVEADNAAQEDLKKAEDLKNKGVVLGADFYAARVRAGRFIQAKNALLLQVGAMKKLMNIMMGEPASNNFIMAAGLPEADLPVISAAALAQDSEVLRPDLQAALLRVNVGREELRRAKDTSLPSVMLTADGTNNRHDLGDRGGNNAAAGINVEMSLFDPSRSARVKAARAVLERAQQEADMLKDLAKQDIVREAARFEALLANYPVVKAMAEDAGQAVDLLLPLYDEGRKSIIDLEDARDARFSALSAFAEMQAALYSSQARLFFLGGKLNATAMQELSHKIGG